jgi:endoglucanase
MRLRLGLFLRAHRRGAIAATAAVAIAVTVAVVALLPAGPPPSPRAPSTPDTSPPVSASPAAEGRGHQPAPPDAGIAFPLRTSGASIVDASGRPVKLDLVNWYGFESPDYVAGGLRYQPVSTIISEIKAMGFNGVRLPWSNEMWESDPLVSGNLVTANPQFAGEHARDVFTQVVLDLADAGLMVVLDDHSSNAEWCCSTSDGNELWYNSAYPQSSWLSDWQAVARHFSQVPQVIGVDLRNEPRGPAAWGGGNPADDWPAAAQQAGDDVLSVNPNLLIFVEGVNYATDLSGVASLPIRLSRPDQLVYSVHDYGFDTTVTSYDQWVSKIQSQWGYLVGKVPLWVGEFGTCDNSGSCVSSPSSSSLGLWFSVFTRYLLYHNLNWSYWALNGTKSDGAAGQGISYGEPESYGVLDTQWNVPSLGSLLGALHQIQGQCPGGSLPSGTYEIRNRSSGDVIDVPQSNSAQGTDLDQWPPNNGVNQHWQVTSLGCGLYTITSAMDGEALEIFGQSTGSGAKVDQWEYWGGGSQQFLITPAATGYYTISSINSMEPVEVPGGSSAAGALLAQSSANGSASQQWSFAGA